MTAQEAKQVKLKLKTMLSINYIIEVAKDYQRYRKCVLMGHYCPDCEYHEAVWQGDCFEGFKCNYGKGR